MASTTLEEVKLELEISNETSELIKNNSDVVVEYLDLQLDYIQEGFANLLKWFQGNELGGLERAKEDAAFRDKLLKALQQLDKDDKPIPEDEKSVQLADLAKWSVGAAAALGALIGAAKGLGSAMGALGKTAGNLIKIFSPEKWNKFFANLKESLKMKWGNFKLGLQTKIKDLKTRAFGMFERVGKFFDDFKKGLTSDAMVKRLSNFGSQLKAAFEPINKQFKSIIDTVKSIGGKSKKGGVLAKIGEWFTHIKSLLGEWGRVLGKIVGFVAKVFAPLAWILGIYQSITAMMDAAAEDKSWIKIIEAGLDALVESIVAMPLDLLKDVVSWALEKMGFEEASKWLDSWSFMDVWNGLSDWFFDTMDTLWKWAKGEITFDQIRDKVGFGDDDIAAMGEALFGWWDEFTAWMSEVFSWKNIKKQLTAVIPDNTFTRTVLPDSFFADKEGASASTGELKSDKGMIGDANTFVMPSQEEIQKMAPEQQQNLMQQYGEFAAQKSAANEAAPKIIYVQGAQGGAGPQPAPHSTTTIVPIEANPHSRGPSWDEMSVMP